MIRYILGMVLLVGICMSCKDDKVEEMGDRENQEKFMQQTEIGVYEGGSIILAYHSDEHQLVFDSEGRSWRIQTDKQDKYVSCELTATPQVEQILKVDIKAKGVERVNSAEVSGKILKIENMKCWLWIPSVGIGFLMRME